MLRTRNQLNWLIELIVDIVTESTVNFSTHVSFLYSIITGFSWKKHQ